MTFVNHRCTGGFTYFALHFIHATFCIEPRKREYRKYVWAKDKDGNYINEPEDHDNHGIDAARYWVLGELLGKIIKSQKVSKEELGIW